jgi:hypothetical protein
MMVDIAISDRDLVERSDIFCDFLTSSEWEGCATKNK